MEVECSINHVTVDTPTPSTEYHLPPVSRHSRIIVITRICGTSWYTRFITSVRVMIRITTILNWPCIPIKVCSCQVVASFSIIRVPVGLENMSVVFFREEDL